VARTVLLLHHDTYSRQAIRIVGRLIISRYKTDPDFFTPYAPVAIMALAREHQPFFPALYPWFAFYARNIAGGQSFAQVRESEVENTVRAVAKRRAVPRR